MMKKTAALSIVMMAIGAGATAAHANTVNLDTFNGSGWTVTRVLSGGESNTTAVSDQAVAEVANNPGWNVLADSNAKWVSWSSGTGTGYTGDVNGTSYIYSKTFTLGDFSGSGAFSLSGTFLTDNYATDVSLTIGGAPVPVTLTGTVVPPTPTEFGYRYSVDVDSASSFTSPETFVLTITTVNSYADAGNLANQTNPGPTGLAFSGVASASAVPTPDAALAGLSLLGGLGGMSVLRKRVLRI